MESSQRPADLLRTAERGEAAPWVDYPVTPSWYPPAVGVWAALIALGLARVDHWWGALCLVVAVVGEVAFIGWYRRLRGAMPSGGMPEELRTPATLVVAGLLGVVVVTVAASLWGPAWTGPVVALVLTTALVWCYERAYARAAAAARARLA